ncbi:hypothetical protein BaRGS_00018248, partial [Batillaria attramentaria]
LPLWPQSAQKLPAAAEERETLWAVINRERERGRPAKVQGYCGVVVLEYNRPKRTEDTQSADLATSGQRDLQRPQSPWRLQHGGCSRCFVGPFPFWPLG